MKNYADALIAYSAHSSDVDLIITRNIKSFEQSPIKAITPEKFVADFKPSYVDYSEEEIFQE